MLRRDLLRCTVLPGLVGVWCGEAPQVTEGRLRRWTGYPPNPEVSGWHRLDGDDSATVFFWDSRVLAWRYFPDAFEATSAGEMSRDGMDYRGPSGPP